MQFAPNHTASNKESQDLNLGSVAPENNKLWSGEGKRYRIYTSTVPESFLGL